MKYLLKVEETIIHALEIELDTEITNLTDAERSHLFMTALVEGEVAYDGCDYDYEILE